MYPGYHFSHRGNPQWRGRLWAAILTPLIAIRRKQNQAMSRRQAINLYLLKAKKRSSPTSPSVTPVRADVGAGTFLMGEAEPTYQAQCEHMAALGQSHKESVNATASTGIGVNTGFGNGYHDL